ncbi:N-acetylglucosamine kinase [Streptantibioticus silvisoli]|uniref:BadF/BadG/BcrA/BcrD ATPase family protein n=1 Tax=Streptantibioticus silvisoli TaxID=2705255 RepID=A0ABT6VUN5_9ACTN|nr:BadF/BadG/BcrA/BcrD ATPase family protein [Streptantibioticus silvisoli]MDI5962167.1 BadF/BadG/BcrA/BcrD ATPase family protein [Streptantibioticus silvisoli]
MTTTAPVPGIDGPLGAGLPGATGTELVRGVLAVDAGNSKTDVAIVAADGTVLGTARGDGFVPHLVGPRAAVDGLAPLVALAAERAGLDPGAGRPLVTHTSACLANADLPVEERKLGEEIAGRGWSRTTVVANDVFALLRSGTDEPRGVAVVCGAGINCAGLLPDGRTVRFPALGMITGDWGGGGSLALEVMWHAVRAEDGRGAETALAPAVAGHFGLPTAMAVAEAVHLGALSKERLHELVPVLFRVAGAGDTAAVRLVERQAEEVARLALVALRRLDLLDEPVDVVLGGGVLAAGQRLLLDGVFARLAAGAPKAVPRIATTAPVVGAALLGLDHLAAVGLGGGPHSHERLRAGHAVHRSGQSGTG